MYLLYPQLKPLLILVYIGACAAYPSGPPVSTCEGMSPLHFGSDRRPLPAQPGNTNPYRITVSNSSYSPGDTLTVTISSQTADQFKGFILQARGAGSNSPVGVFTGSLASHTQFIWCSGGEPQVSKLLTFCDWHFTVEPMYICRLILNNKITEISYNIFTIFNNYSLKSR